MHVIYQTIFVKSVLEHHLIKHSAFDTPLVNCQRVRMLEALLYMEEPLYGRSLIWKNLMIHGNILGHPSYLMLHCLLLYKFVTIKGKIVCCVNF